MRAILLALVASTALGQGYSGAPSASSLSAAAQYSVPQTTGKVCFNSPTNTVCFSLSGTTLTLSGTTDLSISGGSSTSGFATFQSGQFAGNLIVTGYVSGGTPIHMASVYLNGVVVASTLGGLKIPARANTFTEIGFYVSSAASGAGTTTFRVSDGTNNCDFAVDCATSSNSIGPKSQATTGGTCVFAASALLTISITATTCATTQPTIKNVEFWGKWQ